MKMRSALAIASMASILVWAVFATRSLSIVTQLYTDYPDPEQGMNSHFLFVSLGVGVFSATEVVFLCWLSPKIWLAPSLGRLIQVFGFVMVSHALFAGMIDLRILAGPNGSTNPIEIAKNFDSDASALAIGLWIVLLGNILVAFGRLFARNSQEKVERRIIIYPLCLILVLVLCLFIITTIFEFELISKLNELPELSLISVINDFQGMMIYPFLAYLLGIAYCILDILRLVLNRSVRSTRIAIQN